LCGAPTEISNKTHEGRLPIGSATSTKATIKANESLTISRFHQGDRELTPAINAIAARAIALHRNVRP
jgi:hypothetical protein